MKTFHTWAGCLEDLDFLWPLVRRHAFERETAAVRVALVTAGEQTRTLEQVLLTAVPGHGADELRAWLTWCEGRLPVPFDGVLIVEVGDVCADEPSVSEHEVAVGALQHRQRSLNERELQRVIELERAELHKVLEQTTRLAAHAPEAMNASNTILWALAYETRRSSSPPRPGWERAIEAGAAGLARGVVDAVTPTPGPVRSPRELRQSLRTALSYVRAHGDERLGQMFARVGPLLEQGTEMDIVELRLVHAATVSAVESALLEAEDAAPKLGRAYEILTGRRWGEEPQEEEEEEAEAPGPRPRRRRKRRKRRKRTTSAERPEDATDPDSDLKLHFRLVPMMLAEHAKSACSSCAESLNRAATSLGSAGSARQGAEQVRAFAEAMTRLVGDSWTCQARCLGPPGDGGAVARSLGVLADAVERAGGKLLLCSAGEPFDTARHRAAFDDPDGRYCVTQLIEFGWTYGETDGELPQVALGLPLLFSTPEFPGLAAASEHFVSLAPANLQGGLRSYAARLETAARSAPDQACGAALEVIHDLTARTPAIASGAKAVLGLNGLAAQIIDQAGGQVVSPEPGDDVEPSLLDDDDDRVDHTVDRGFDLEALIRGGVSMTFGADEE